MKKLLKKLGFKVKEGQTYYHIKSIDCFLFLHQETVDEVQFTLYTREGTFHDYHRLGNDRLLGKHIKELIDYYDV